MVLPTAASTKLGKNIGIAAAILKDVGIIWDDVLGSEDEPAINAVYAICSFMHKKQKSRSGYFKNLTKIFTIHQY